MEAWLEERFEQDFGPKGSFVIERMAHIYNLAIDKLKPLHVQAVNAVRPGIDFILGDSPFVYYTDDEIRVGGQSGLALGDAEHLFLPVSPRLAVMFSAKQEPDLFIDPCLVQRLNSLSWRAAFSQVICHPTTDFRESIAGRPLAQARAVPTVANHDGRPAL
ncbi:hypothetical protein BH23ACT12_BH23ACT12_18310 [soil metagenome]